LKKKHPYEIEILRPDHFFDDHSRRRARPNRRTHRQSRQWPLLLSPGAEQLAQCRTNGDKSWRTFGHHHEQRRKPVDSRHLRQRKSNLWIGLNDRQVEGTFQWLTGESVFYTNWEPGQPDNDLGNEDAAFMWPLTSPAAGQWGDSLDTFDFWASGVVEVVPPVVQIQSGVNVSWTSLSNINYQVQYSTVLASNTWVNLGAQIKATGTNSSVFDAFGAGGNRFYRIVQVP
jgi:hypothetical protein